ncbi:type I restriction enzyme HsdR N-terminal domain-containing protein [Nocardiopsis sp. CT-R113]|uniref:Type I restriction enzyme HsdR N-terminal domain-containing protein n=1 Tax=Nocardiopsis codii TaxID=3065942 RepID=A0ABU7KA64_9ACTN|nr:type I restriction endonuclease [Nocardiopsis sp. CT-R113]MEE2038789.1 type I restriction enzyme HsdR N-terminal domain-containing protein [Nocardiopsis sp. CT-R113]
MQFEEKVSALASKVQKQRDMTQTEEAAKNAFVMPFIATILGYDVFDPREVVPEFTADVGMKKGEKVDYAIVRDNEVQILIECKKANGELKVEHASQLYRYFSVTNARIAVLTNGVEYQFYTDLEAPNRMDSKPFMVLDFSDIDESLLPELRKLTRETFDLNSVIDAAEKLKYLGAIKRTLAEEFQDPEDEWVKFFASRVYDKSFTKRAREQFTPLVREAASAFLDDQVNLRLKKALESTRPQAETEAEAVSGQEAATEDLERGTGIETTLEELEGYQVVKAIACSEVKPQRIAHRDSKSYFAILLDDNNRRPIARLHFNARSKKYLGVFDADKNETRHLLGSIDDIYLHADKIREVVRSYLA